MKVVRHALTVWALIHATGLSGQQTIADGVQCPQCTVRFTLEARMGEADGPAALTGQSSIVVDGQGRYWVLGRQAPIQVFRPDGQFLRALGREGDGPGEFRGALVAGAAIGDSVAVFDGTGRVTVFDQGFRVVRTGRLPAAPNLYLTRADISILSWPHAVVMNALVGSAQGRALHLADVSGPEPRLVRSFGGEDADRPIFMTRTFAPPSAERFWSADHARYLVQQWDSSGNRLAGFRRTAAWFPDYVQGTPFYSRDKAPISRIRALGLDSRGRLWVFMSVAAPNWQQIIRAACPEGVPCLNPEGIYMEQVEVIDPSGVLLARAPSRRVTATLSGSRAVAYSEEGLVPRVEVLRFELVEPR